MAGPNALGHQRHEQQQHLHEDGSGQRHPPWLPVYASCLLSDIDEALP
jgi:hypothetical protein